MASPFYFGYQPTGKGNDDLPPTYWVGPRPAKKKYRPRPSQFKYVDITGLDETFEQVVEDFNPVLMIKEQIIKDWKKSLAAAVKPQGVSVLDLSYLDPELEEDIPGAVGLKVSLNPQDWIKDPIAQLNPFSKDRRDAVWDADDLYTDRVEKIFKYLLGSPTDNGDAAALGESANFGWRELIENNLSEEGRQTMWRSMEAQAGGSETLLERLDRTNEDLASYYRSFLVGQQVRELGGTPADVETMVRGGGVGPFAMGNQGDARQRELQRDVRTTVLDFAKNSRNVLVRDTKYEDMVFTGASSVMYELDRAMEDAIFARDLAAGDRGAAWEKLLNEARARNDALPQNQRVSDSVLINQIKHTPLIGIRSDVRDAGDAMYNRLSAKKAFADRVKGLDDSLNAKAMAKALYLAGADPERSAGTVASVAYGFAQNLERADKIVAYDAVAETFTEYDLSTQAGFDGYLDVMTRRFGSRRNDKFAQYDKTRMRAALAGYVDTVREMREVAGTQQLLSLGKVLRDPKASEEAKAQAQKQILAIAENWHKDVKEVSNGGVLSALSLPSGFMDRTSPDGATRALKKKFALTRGGPFAKSLRAQIAQAVYDEISQDAPERGPDGQLLGGILSRTDIGPKFQPILRFFERERQYAATENFMSAVFDGKVFERIIWPKLKVHIEKYTPAYWTTEILTKLNYFGLTLEADNFFEVPIKDAAGNIVGSKLVPHVIIFGQKISIEDVGVELSIFGRKFKVNGKWFQPFAEKNVFRLVLKADGTFGFSPNLSPLPNLKVAGKTLLGDIYKKLKPGDRVFEIEGHSSFGVFAEVVALGKTVDAKGNPRFAMSPEAIKFLLSLDATQLQRLLDGDFDDNPMIFELKAYFLANFGGSSQDPQKALETFVTNLSEAKRRLAEAGLDIENLDLTILSDFLAKHGIVGASASGIVDISQSYSGYLNRLVSKYSHYRAVLFEKFPILNYLPGNLKANAKKALSKLLERGLEYIIQALGYITTAGAGAVVIRVLRPVLSAISSKIIDLGDKLVKAIIKGDFSGFFKDFDETLDRIAKYALLCIVMPFGCLYIFITNISAFMEFGFSQIEVAIGQFASGDSFGSALTRCQSRTIDPNNCFFNGVTFRATPNYDPKDTVNGWQPCVLTDDDPNNDDCGDTGFGHGSDNYWGVVETLGDPKCSFDIPSRAMTSSVSGVGRARGPTASVAPGSVCTSSWPRQDYYGAAYDLVLGAVDTSEPETCYSVYLPQMGDITDWRVGRKFASGLVGRGAILTGTGDADGDGIEDTAKLAVMHLANIRGGTKSAGEEFAVVADWGSNSHIHIELAIDFGGDAAGFQVINNPLGANRLGTDLYLPACQ